MEMNCNHTERHLLNPYEIIRKYECADCGAILMCECESDVGHFYVPHQLEMGVRLHTQERVPVTHGFVPGLCDKCRGYPLTAHPKAPMHGATSKVRRYYWHEILFLKIRKLIPLAAEIGVATYQELAKLRPDAIQKAEQEAVAEIKQLHDESPIYSFEEPSQEEVVRRYSVQIVEVSVTYAPRAQGRRAAILLDGTSVSAETYAAKRYENLGFNVVFCESAPLHFLFGTFMYLLIQDPNDEMTRTCSFGSRSEEGKVIHTILPADFGTVGYYARRKSAILDHVLDLSTDREELLWLFDYWSEDDNSGPLRQYLWAHGPEDRRKARILVQHLPPKKIQSVLLYLTKEYWKRYCGWPDLFCYRSGEYRFVEVKTSNDKLSNDQKNWIEGNSLELNLPFELMKLIRGKVAT